MPSLILLAAACSPQEDDRLSNLVESQPAQQAPVNEAAAGKEGELPANRTSAEGSIDLRGPRAAREVLQHYFSLLKAGRQDDAAGLWWDKGRAAQFAARLRGFGDFHASIAAPGRIEGAAGSAYVSISLQLLRDSRTLSDGTAVLRRVNDVPGSTAEQRRWRIDRVSLQPPPAPLSKGPRFVGRWASDERRCGTLAWRFTATSLRTPAGSACRFRRVTEVPGGYDIVASCTAEGPPVSDTLKLRFAESARALLFESDSIADAGLVRCP